MTNIRIDIPYELWRAVDGQNDTDMSTDDLIISIIQQWVRRSYPLEASIASEEL